MLPAPFSSLLPSRQTSDVNRCSAQFVTILSVLVQWKACESGAGSLEMARASSVSVVSFQYFCTLFSLVLFFSGISKTITGSDESR